MEGLCLGILLPHWDNQMKHIVSGLVDMDLHECKCFIDAPVQWAEVSVCLTFPMCDAVSPTDETLLSVRAVFHDPYSSSFYVYCKTIHMVVLENFSGSTLQYCNHFNYGTFLDPSLADSSGLSTSGLFHVWRVIFLFSLLWSWELWECYEVFSLLLHTGLSSEHPALRDGVLLS